MAVPKKRTSLTRRRLRRTHYNAKVLAAGKCIQCGKAVLNFTACNSCGFYKNRSYASVLNIKPAA